MKIQPLVDLLPRNNNNRGLIVGPFFSSRLHPMLKNTPRTSHTEVYIITKSFLNYF